MLLDAQNVFIRLATTSLNLLTAPKEERRSDISRPPKHPRNLTSICAAVNGQAKLAVREKLRDMAAKIRIWSYEKNMSFQCDSDEDY
jgi:hypothetical protein